MRARMPTAAPPTHHGIQCGMSTNCRVTGRPNTHFGITQLIRRTDSRHRSDTVRWPSSQAISIALLPNPTTITRLPRSGTGESGFR